jgi:hypothetical protein
VIRSPPLVVQIAPPIHFSLSFHQRYSLLLQLCFRWSFYYGQVFRADAAFAKPEISETLEERDVKYAIRLPANDNLQRNTTALLTRPAGRPRHKPVVRYKGFFIRQRVGSRRGGWWLRWSSIAGSCFRAWGSS